MIKQTKILGLLAFATLSLGLTACNTISGAGQDIENGGEAIQKAAN